MQDLQGIRDIQASLSSCITLLLKILNSLSSNNVQTAVVNCFGDNRSHRMFGRMLLALYGNLKSFIFRLGYPKETAVKRHLTLTGNGMDT
ncbi:hypothetical protein NPIL_199041 [Nephila pilipes]|uniref:Uncharacterized protein n=1 Tax=Nephila pilipes TaxID=299642 RepID=A0A8X6NQP8_NEPPI|nr:hypothetical protein NPIL_199041 [Nephila pilipes]